MECKAFFFFPGSGSQTVFSITLEDNSQTKTFGYTFKGKPEANVPLNIGGSYSGDVTVGGSLISGEWKAPVDIKFNFGGADEGNGLPLIRIFPGYPKLAVSGTAVL